MQTGVPGQTLDLKREGNGGDVCVAAMLIKKSFKKSLKIS